MFTAPVIPSAVTYHSEVLHDETSNGYDGERPVTIVSHPPNVISSVSTSFNTIPEALTVSSVILCSCSNFTYHSQEISSSIPSAPLPRLGCTSQHCPQGIWGPNWAELTARYNVNQLLKHTWDWEQSKLVPHYDFQKISTFEDLWREYTEGLNGYLPFREIKERWAANPAWHRNDGSKKNEFTRRKKTIELIETLTKRPHWSISITLKFLTERYGNKVIGTFTRELSKDLSTKILAEATDYR